MKADHFFQALVENSPDPVVAVDAQGRILYQTPAAELIAGYTPLELEVAGSGVLHPEERAEEEAFFKYLLQKPGHSALRRHRLRRKDGSYIYIEARATNLLEEPTVQAVVYHYRDVTDRVLAEREARSVQMRFQNALDHMLEACQIIDFDWRYVYVNQALADQGRRRTDELLGQTMMAAYPGIETTSLFARLEHCMQKREAARFENLFVFPDGHKGWFDLHIFPVPEGIAIFSVDITEIKTTQNRLQWQASLLDHARDAIMVRDQDQRIVYWNQSAERLYGYSAAEVMGQALVDHLYVDLQAFRAASDWLYDHGEWGGELLIRAKDGRELTVDAQWSLVQDRDGQAAILAINTDITARKTLEGQLMRSQRLESLGTLAGGIAHDLNNVLNPIYLSTALLKMNDLDEESLILVETIDRNARRGADIVRQVLTFARGSDGQRVQVDLAGLVSDVERIVLDSFPKNIQWSKDIQTGSPITGDPTQLHQVLLNLCVNARDAMPQGGKLKITARDMLLDEHYVSMNAEARPGPYVLIEVEDTGHGMNSATIEKIFDPFFTTKEIGAGTGLGLSTSIALIKGHGGFIRVYSEVDRGSTFRVYLPVGEGKKTAADPAPVVLPRGAGQTILIVDDEPAVLLTGKQTLEAFGYRVLTAADGAQALALYVQNRAQVAAVITDLAMPHMDGVSLIKALLRIQPDLKIIAASGYAERSLELVRMDKHKVPFLDKPYTAENLLGLLHHVLSREKTGPQA